MTTLAEQPGGFNERNRGRIARTVVKSETDPNLFPRDRGRWPLDYGPDNWLMVVIDDGAIVDPLGGSITPAPGRYRYKGFLLSSAAFLNPTNEKPHFFFNLLESTFGDAFLVRGDFVLVKRVEARLIAMLCPSAQDGDTLACFAGPRGWPS